MVGWVSFKEGVIIVIIAFIIVVVVTRSNLELKNDSERWMRTNIMERMTQRKVIGLDSESNDCNSCS